MFTSPNLSKVPFLIRYYFNRNDYVKNWVKFYLFLNFIKFKVRASNDSEWLKNAVKLAKFSKKSQILSNLRLGPEIT